MPPKHSQTLPAERFLRSACRFQLWKKWFGGQGLKITKMFASPLVAWQPNSGDKTPGTYNPTHNPL